MSVDAEGSELEILQSNDWHRFRPELVLAEYHCKSVEEAMNSNLTEFMRSVNYKLIAKMYYSLVYYNQKNPSEL